MAKHTLNGNCWEIAYDCKKCGVDELCDVCHKHNQPRGECSDCRQCDFCLDE